MVSVFVFFPKAVSYSVDHTCEYLIIHSFTQVSGVHWLLMYQRQYAKYLHAVVSKLDMFLYVWGWSYLEN